MDNEKIIAKVDAYVEEVWPDVEKDIAGLVAIPSRATHDNPQEGAPFGSEVREALNYALGVAEKLGYETSTDDGYVGICDIAGEGDKQLATIAHVDIVPAGPGWDGDPFKMEIRDGWFVGRGVLDDKGPAILSLYAGAYFLKNGIKPRHNFRALLGCDEEIGMLDLEHYLANHEEPDFLFTPDAEYPLCNAEKGVFHGFFKSAPCNGNVLSLHGAEASNAIPMQAECEIGIDKVLLPPVDDFGGKVTIEKTQDGTKIVAHGVGGHASKPEGTENAVKILIDYLQNLRLAFATHDTQAFSDEEQNFFDLATVAMTDTKGESAGVATSNDKFGELTMVCGYTEVQEDRLVLSVDIRYPDSTSAEELEAKLSELAAHFGCEFEVEGGSGPFWVSADDPAVQVLLDTHNEVRGRNDNPIIMGGGTYARRFTRAVSFGAEDLELELPSWGGPMHGPNEVANVELMKTSLKIYILSLLRLQEIDL